MEIINIASSHKKGIPPAHIHTHGHTLVVCYRCAKIYTKCCTKGKDSTYTRLALPLPRIYRSTWGAIKYAQLG